MDPVDLAGPECPVDPMAPEYLEILVRPVHPVGPAALACPVGPAGLVGHMGHTVQAKAEEQNKAVSVADKESANHIHYNKDIATYLLFYDRINQ